MKKIMLLTLFFTLQSYPAQDNKPWQDNGPWHKPNKEREFCRQLATRIREIKLYYPHVHFNSDGMKDLILYAPYSGTKYHCENLGFFTKYKMQKKVNALASLERAFFKCSILESEVSSELHREQWDLKKCMQVSEESAAQSKEQEKIDKKLDSYIGSHK